MRSQNHDEFEALKRRAIDLGNAGNPSAYRELTPLLASPYPVVRKSAASALRKLFLLDPTIGCLCKAPLMSAIKQETGEQALQYLIRTYGKCANYFNQLDLDLLQDIVRDPNHQPYVRREASEVIADFAKIKRTNEARSQHWCTRCKKTISVQESEDGIRSYGKPYCYHCLEEKRMEDLEFEADIEKAKLLRTSDDVAVQSKGEKRIGDWLADHHIAYRYDERMIVAGDIRIRPDFYLPEFDVYIEYWGMNTPEYIENMQMKQILYQRDRKKLISLSYKDFDNLEALLAEKLSRYLKLT